MIKESFSTEETFQIGYELAKQAEPGDVFCLIGDLGVGKTVFSQGFGAGIGIEDAINSPTFTIVQVYEEGRLPFYHFDVYRIGDEEELFEIGFDEILDGDGVSLIEWANLIPGSLPRQYTEIQIEKDLERGFDYRKVTITEVSR
ncbi:MAG: tRNA (adenosine(37)-N6)-threonylcarbamoyltransferase complex ATPase subunit type 1 TsaE [Lachnospiraceae bacterium]|nr:tRNA (adenosine(37)-N6)-threonylcarbamoyltransferase complex ATPase subunit type 1 TsaE [Lachnospiraceae bacterium]MBP3506273.1 tRNA (adenosine(37)-N6)-threonylcarbamoyltransferase complex ATPase subunit type 1 TsaE [Lachnospiraceae bacterium]